MSFHGLMAHFFLVLHNFPLCSCTTVCISIHLWKDVPVENPYFCLRLWVSFFQYDQAHRLAWK